MIPYIFKNNFPKETNRIETLIDLLNHHLENDNRLCVYNGFKPLFGIIIPNIVYLAKGIYTGSNIIPYNNVYTLFLLKDSNIPDSLLKRLLLQIKESFLLASNVLNRFSDVNIEIVRISKLSSIYLNILFNNYFSSISGDGANSEEFILLNELKDDISGDKIEYFKKDIINFQINNKNSNSNSNSAYLSKKFILYDGYYQNNFIDEFVLYYTLNGIKDKFDLRINFEDGYFRIDDFNNLENIFNLNILNRNILELYDFSRDYFLFEYFIQGGSNHYRGILSSMANNIETNTLTDNINGLNIEYNFVLRKNFMLLYNITSSIIGIIEKLNNLIIHSNLGIYRGGLKKVDFIREKNNIKLFFE